MSDFLSRLTEALEWQEGGNDWYTDEEPWLTIILVEGEPLYWCEKDDAPGISPTACWAVKFDGPCRMVERRMIDLPGENE